MASLNLLVPALAGYLLLRGSNFTKFGLLRESGYHVVFRSALWGILLYVAGWFISHSMPLLEASTTQALGINEASLWSLALGFSLGFLPNIWYTALQGARRAAERKGDAIDVLVDEASQTREVVEVSLQGGKTYIGYFYESTIRKYGTTSGELVLIPLFSGYRNSDDQTLHLTTNYVGFLLGTASHGLWDEELKVVVPRSTVRWVRPFDMNLFPGPTGEDVDLQDS